MPILALLPSQVRDALLDRLVEDSAAANRKVAEEYDGMLEVLRKVPSDEAELAALQGFIEEAPERVEKLVDECYATHDRLALLDEFKVVMSEADGWLNWRTLAYPDQVKDAIREAVNTQRE